MRTFHNLGDSIEAENTELNVRKISDKSIGVVKVKNKTFFKYKTKINSEAKICKCISDPDQKIYKPAHIELNDTLSAHAIELYSTKIIREKDKTVNSNYSHVHSIQHIVLKDLAFSVIQIPFIFNPTQDLRIETNKQLGK